jgi:hypothetical protein
MKIVEKNLSSSELANLQKQKEKLRKKVLSDSIIIGVLAFFGLMVLLLISEKFGLITPSVYLKPVLVGLSVLSATIYYLKGLHKLKKQDSSNKKITQYTFTITDFYCHFISNTEYVIYACKITEDKTVVFQTSQLPTDKLFDTLNIDLLNGKIVSIKNYSTGRTVKQLNLHKHLIDSYDQEFYLLDKDIHTL